MLLLICLNGYVSVKRVLPVLFFFFNSSSIKKNIVSSADMLWIQHGIPCVFLLNVLFFCRMFHFNLLSSSFQLRNNPIPLFQYRNWETTDQWLQTWSEPLFISKPGLFKGTSWCCLVLKWMPDNEVQSCRVLSILALIQQRT